MYQWRINRRDFLRQAGVAGLTLTTLPALLEACGAAPSGGTGTASTLDQAKKAGVIRVGFANEAPYAYADSSGKLTGEAPAVATAIMAELGVPKLEGVLTEFGALIPGLLANRFDIIAAGMFITPKRCAQILFSNPDYVATEALAVKAGNPLKLSDYASIAKNSSAIAGAETGAVEGDLMKQSGIPADRLQVFPNGPTGMQAVLSGRIHAFSLTAISLEYLIKTGGFTGLEVTAPFVPVINGKKQIGAGGYGFRKTDADFLAQFNAKLASLQQSGKVASLVDPFGFKGETVSAAQGLTSAELCKAS
jgi:polar amino acid transport system substrate-binding protein